ncbi:MAG: hypothetical protein ACTSRR_13560, partial [Candidatus Heimdallarchaeaceae archaeon]
FSILFSMEEKDNNYQTSVEKPKFKNIFLNILLVSTVFNVLFLIFILLAFTESGDVNWYWFSGAILSIIISGCGAILIIKGKLKIIG